MINNYLTQLYSYLGDAYCFLSGAFIIQDDNGRLFELLMSTNKKRRRLLKSHTTYFQLKERHNNDDFGLYETILDRNIDIKCKCDDKEPDQRGFQSIKWYKFIENDLPFIYFKPESAATITQQHAFETIHKYLLHNPNVSCRYPRREDCRNDPDGCMFVGQEESPYKNYNKILYKREGDNEYKSEDIIDRYNRKGDSVYIPSIINAYILDNIDKSNIFDYDNDDNIILINPISITGGKKRKYKRRHRSKKGKPVNKSLRKKTVKRKRK